MKTKQIKISEVLHLAADTYLCTETKEENWTNYFQFSCSAIKEALRKKLKENNGSLFDYYWMVIRTGLVELGLPDPNGIECFIEFEPGYDPTPESQSARYLWLKWCALMAEEQGV